MVLFEDLKSIGDREEVTAAYTAEVPFGPKSSGLSPKRLQYNILNFNTIY